MNNLITITAEGKYKVALSEFDTHEEAELHLEKTLQTKAAFDKANPHNHNRLFYLPETQYEVFITDKLNNYE